MAKNNCADCIHKDVCALWEIQNEISDTECVHYQPTLTPPNEALICDGCLWAEMGALEKCSSCMRDKKDNYYRRPPEGEEEP